MKYYITEGKGEKQPPGPDRVGLTGTQGVEVIEGHAGQMSDQGTPGKVTIFLDGKYFDSARSHSGGQASSVLKRNQEAPLTKHPTQTHTVTRPLVSFLHAHTRKTHFFFFCLIVSFPRRSEAKLPLEKG